MPPEVRENVTRTLGVWPLPQRTRDGMVDMVAKQMAGVLGSFARRHGAIPEPEAGRAAAAVEAEAFAAANAYAAGRDLATDAARFDVFRTYSKELWSRTYRYAKSRRAQTAAAGTSSAGPAALPPPPPLPAVAAVAAVVPAGPATARGQGRGGSQAGTTRQAASSPGA